MTFDEKSYHLYKTRFGDQRDRVFLGKVLTLSNLLLKKKAYI